MNAANNLLLTDSYKVSHYRQYPPGTTKVFSFLESRGGRYPDVTFFGLQYILKKYLSGMFVTEAGIMRAKEMMAAHFGDPALFNEAGWRHILDKHDGHLPVRIRAVAEGTTVPVHNVLMTVENTDPAVPWLTNWLETILCEVWYPITVATQSRHMKQVLRAYLNRSGETAGIDFKLHDFGFRGSTSVESAALGGAAHLVNFKGTDTMAALMLAREYYGAPMAGFSIPAAEHSTITSWGRESEERAFRNMLLEFPTGLVAVVSDSYDIFNACERLWGMHLKDQVLKRDGVLVVRPDSGNPPQVAGTVLDLLGEHFGSTLNSKGYRVLNPKVRVIQGDGIDASMMEEVLVEVLRRGWSAENIAFGSGGGLLQKVNRDTQRMAFKCSAVEVNGEWRDVMKDPVTDPGKKSKAGRLALVHKDGAFSTMRTDDPLNIRHNFLEPVFENGVVLREQTFEDIRERAAL